MPRAVARLAAFILALAGTAHAQPAKPKGIPPELAPFMDDNTLLVAQLDPAAVGFERTADRVVALLKLGGLPAKEVAEAEAGARAVAGVTSEWASAFAAAGGGKIYVVLPFNPKDVQAYLVVPVAAGGDAAKLTELLRTAAAATNLGGGAAGPDGRPAFAVERLKDALVVSGPVGIRQARLSAANEQPVIRDDLAAAMSVAGDGPVKVAFAPPTLVKRALATAAPKLPPELGGTPTGDLTDAFRYAGASINLPAAQGGDLGLNLTIKATDAAGAAKLKKVIDDVRALAAKEAQKGNVAGADKLLAMADPKVDGDRLVLSLGTAEVESAVKTAVPMALAARERAKSQVVAANLRQVLLGIHIYASNFNGRLPDRLPDDLVEYLGGKESAARVWTNPSRPEQSPPFVYVKPAEKLTGIKNTAGTVILYEAHTAWPANGISVGFADGHVETVATEAEFKKLIEAK